MVCKPGKIGQATCLNRLVRELLVQHLKKDKFVHLEKISFSVALTESRTTYPVTMTYGCVLACGQQLQKIYKQVALLFRNDTIMFLRIQFCS